MTSIISHWCYNGPMGLNLTFIFSILLSFLFLAAIIFLFRKYRRKKIVREKYIFDEYKNSNPFQFQKPYYPNQSKAWKEEMSVYAQQLISKDISTVIFIHGTFTGDDPFDFISLLEHLFPAKALGIIRSIQRAYKKNKSIIFRDLGNFENDYVKLVQEAFGEKINCLNYHWPSANHHYSRLQGLIGLLPFISKEKENVLLVAHSHGGQILALLSQMRNSPTILRQMKNIISQMDAPDALADLRAIRKKTLYYASLGTPARYQWKLGARDKAVHIINHRGEDLCPPLLKGILTTKYGDYIQRMAINGSDSLIGLQRPREISQKMDLIVGPGQNLTLWKQIVFQKSRLHNSGTNILVDFKDHAMTPNFLSTLFGHGTYTRKEYLNFLTSLIVGHLITEKNSDFL